MICVEDIILLLGMVLLGILGSQGLPAPDHFYRVVENRASSLRELGDGIMENPRVVFPSGFPFMANKGCTVDKCGEDLIFDEIKISKNGWISVGGYSDEIYPREFPLEAKETDEWLKQLIAPLWTPLHLQNDSAVYYQYTTKLGILKQAQRDVTTNFECGGNFMPAAVLIVTWYKMGYQECDLSTDIDKCRCLIYRAPQYCDCDYEYYAVDDYCRCRETNNTCVCSYVLDFWVHKYCDCLAEYNDEWCDCYWENYYERGHCACMRRRNDEDTCYCAYQMAPGYPYSEAYCYCLHGAGLSWDECQCYEYYKEEFCLCLRDYWDTFYTEEQFNLYYLSFGKSLYGAGFCNCVTNEEPLSSCLCSADMNQTTEYCVCLDNYESFLEESGANHTVIHAFCLCMVDSSDPAACGCEFCPSPRSVDSRMKEINMAIDEKNDMTLQRREVDGESTFQAVLMTDGRQSYVIFNYGSINIPPEDDGRYLVTVGFNVGGKEKYHFNHHFSRSKRLPKLLKKSNVGVSGRWMYRIDGESVQEPHDC